jgi:hypothetical protein
VFLVRSRALFFLVTDTGRPNRGNENDDTYDTELAELITSQKPDDRELSEGQKS